MGRDRDRDRDTQPRKGLDPGALKINTRHTLRTQALAIVTICAAHELDRVSREREREREREITTHTSTCHRCNLRRRRTWRHS